MAFNFPASPTTGQVVSVNGRDFLYNGIGWIPAPLGADVAPIDQTSILGTDSLYGYRTGIGKVEWDYDVLKSDILASVPAGGTSYNVTTWEEIQAICGSQATGDSVCINVSKPINIFTTTVLQSYVKNITITGCKINLYASIGISGLESGTYNFVFSNSLGTNLTNPDALVFSVGDSQFDCTYGIYVRAIVGFVFAAYSSTLKNVQVVSLNSNDTIVAYCNSLQNAVIDTSLPKYFIKSNIFFPDTNLYNITSISDKHTSTFTCDMSGRFTIRCRYNNVNIPDSHVTVVLIPAIPAYINIHDAVLVIIQTASGGDSTGITFPRFFLETAGNYWIAIAGGDVPGTKTEYRNDRGVGQYTSLLDGVDMINLTASPFTAQLYGYTGTITAEFVLTGILIPSN